MAATALFGLEGAAAAAHAGFDLLGVVVVGLIVALAGGVLRDVLLGDLPPAALRTPSRIVAGLTGALVAFVFIEVVDAFPVLPLQILDAIGLALFAVTGAQK
ncbi:membrane protein, partial [Microbacterium testaceum]